MRRFQSTLPQGERPCEKNADKGYLAFQSTLPQGGATNSTSALNSSTRISIHAPTRGATSRIVKTIHIIDFNPRSHKGSDFGLSPVSSRHPVFQSTLPQGERRLHDLGKCGRFDFNPRSHKGSDVNEGKYYFYTQFQSTLPQGERPSLPFMYDGVVFISIHAPTRGATSNTRISSITDFDFNPRSHKGSDYSGFDDLLQKWISIHAPTRGATQHRYTGNPA